MLTFVKAVGEEKLECSEALLRSMGGYSASKLVGELITYEANRRGLSSIIIRPSSISPHQQTGDFNFEDTFCRIITACLMQSSAPNVSEVQEEMGGTFLLLLNKRKRCTQSIWFLLITALN